MIIWSGFGILIPVIVAICAVLSQLLLNAAVRDDQYYQSHSWPPLIALTVSAIFVWLLSQRLSRQPSRRLIDPATGKTVLLQRRDSLFFVPVRYWPPILVVVGMVLVFT